MVAAKEKARAEMAARLAARPAPPFGQDEREDERF
jgi:hypothetical protein